MNEQTENLVNHALAGIIQSASDVKQFAVEQVPDVLQQLIIWKMSEAAIGTVFGLAIFCFLLKWHKEWKPLEMAERKNKPWHEQSDWICAIQPILMIVVSIISFLFMANIMDVVKIAVAPKLYLLEYAASLVK